MLTRALLPEPQHPITHLKVLLGSHGDVQTARVHAVTVGRQLVGPVENGRGCLQLLHGHSGVHEPLVTPHQQLHRFIRRAGERLLKVRQHQLQGSGLQLADGRPEDGDQAEELLGAEALLPQEAHGVPPGLRRPQEHV